MPSIKKARVSQIQGKEREGEMEWTQKSWMTKMVWSVATIIVSLMVVIMLEKLWLKPRRIRSVLEKQGIKGPRPCFPMGNLYEIKEIQSHLFNNTTFTISQPEQWFYFLLPFLQQWEKQYGAIFVYSIGNTQHLHVGDPKLLKELYRLKTWDLGKPTELINHLKPLLGSGIIVANGPHWSFQRNLIAPQFQLSKIQNIVDFMEESIKAIIKKWERIIEESRGEMTEIVIDNDMKELSGDIISKVCFGGSYALGNQIFAKLTALHKALSKSNAIYEVLSPRILPTNNNKEIWRLEKEIKELISKVVHHHKLQNQSCVDQNEKDLLQIILENIDDDEAKNNGGGGVWGILKKLKHKSETHKLIMDMCKNIYFAGFDTTSTLLTWTLIQLSLYPYWQDRLRSEILEAFPNISPHCFWDMDKLGSMKQESLRLYGPAIRISREAFEDIKLGDIVVPKGTNIWVFIAALHRDTEIWGEDANEFKPERFERGVSKACKHPQAYLPFGFGPRICIGQKFSIIEAKITLILLLSNFSFSISPNYHHCPIYNLVLSPKYGTPLLVTKL